MNRREMEEIIKLRVPVLATDEEKHWKNVEILRQEFVNDFSASKIDTMQLDDFVIGKGQGNRSFCYRLEREMDDLGRILGATAFKFGVYFGKTKSDSSVMYRFPLKWGNSAEEALAAVKAEILALLEAASRKDIKALNLNRLSPMFKGKLLFVYYPDEYAPIYSREHLEYFCAELNLHADPDSSVEMQRALMGYRRSWPELKKHSPVLFMEFLYQVFPQVKHPSQPDREASPLPLLDDAIKGAIFIDKMPLVTLPNNKSATNLPKIDYIEQQKSRKRIGARGEAIVVTLEKKRLQDEGRPDLADKVEHVADKTDLEGYDILSYECDGVQRYIEVKATTSDNLGRGFYISSNELEKSRLLPNYYLYIVFAATSKSPKILPIKEPALNGKSYKIVPVAYHVTILSDGDAKM